MANFGEQPTSVNRDRISENEASAEELKKQLAEATASGDMDKVIELAGQAKSLKGQKEEFINKDEEEAYAENAERKDYDEAVAEDAERTKEKEEAAARAKELEELKLKDKNESEEKAAALLEKIKSETVTKEESGEVKPETSKKTESAFEQMKAQYNDVVEKLKIKKDQLKELENKRDELFKERKAVEGTGNQQRLDEINKELEEIFKKQDSVRNEEIDLMYKKKDSINEFKKQNGYDESLAAEGRKLGYRSGETDANRKFMNDYLGTEMPIFSKEFKLGKKFKNKDGEELPYVINDNSQEGVYNQSLLAKKQVELWQRATDAMHALEKISKEIKRELIEEHKLEYDAIMDSAIIEGIYQPFLEVTKETGRNTGKSAAIIRPNEKFYPEDVKKYAGTGYELTQKGLANERWIKSALFLQKIAKEKGLIG